MYHSCLAGLGRRFQVRGLGRMRLATAPSLPRPLVARDRSLTPTRSDLLDLTEFRSTGVARPKIDTATFTRERASSISSTTPENEANGPSATRTFSPISNDTDAFGRSPPSCTWARIRIASASEIGIGLFSAPRKPVTFGVFLIR